MIRSSTYYKFLAILLVLGVPLILSQPAFAAANGVSNIESFIKSIIAVFSAIAGLVATFFLVMGGFSYITSSGNPEHLDRAKRTILFSLIGLAIVIGAFVISNIVTDLATKAFGS